MRDGVAERSIFFLKKKQVLKKWRFSYACSVLFRSSADTDIIESEIVRRPRKVWESTILLYSTPILKYKTYSFVYLFQNIRYVHEIIVVFLCVPLFITSCFFCILK